MFDSILIERNDFSLSKPHPISDHSAHEPDICLDGSRNPWVIWSERAVDGDIIRLKRLGDSKAALRISAVAGVACQPALAVESDGTINCVWVTHRDDQWHLMHRTVSNGQCGPEAILASSKEGIFKPRLLIHEGVIWAVFEYVAQQNSSIHWMKFDHGAWSQPVSINTGPGDSFRPSIAAGNDGSVWMSADTYDGEHYRVIITRLNHSVNPYSISDRFIRNVQSELTPDGDGGCWIAFASTGGNREHDPWWLTKYAVLRRFDGEKLWEPDTLMPSRDLHNEDSFQGWEFPELAVDVYQRVWLFGQASHTLYAQYFSSEGWSDRFTIAPERWGSWKPRVRAVGSGPIYIVSMGLQGAQVQRLNVHPPPTEAPPDWYLASTRATAPPPPVIRSTQDGTRVSGALSSVSSSNNRVFFGDLHAHSVYGDAVGDIDEFYFRYRDAYGYDFATLTEHDYLDGMQLSRSELAMMWAAADRMTVEGQFVALYGYEWTSPALDDHAGPGGTVGEGHRHVLYPDKSGPLISYGERSSNTGKKLLDRLEGHRALVIPHHTAWSGTDLDAYDPALSRLIEIVSTHGRFEYPGNRPIGYRRDHVHPGKYVVDALAKGQRLGFVGGSDSHGLRWHATEMEGRAAHIPPGTRVGWKEDAYRTGMTAILAPELTRAALFDALYDRRCYATSGVRIVLDFRVNDAIMGSEIAVSSAPRLNVSVEGTAPLTAIEFVRQGFTFETRRFAKGERQTSAQMEITDDLLIPGESQYYYVRVIQEDGNMAWSSPIWVTYA